ncbi:hypothetical protein NLI96_g531 [Meripilus lineatus]|uniref:Hydrophobin n=1 Tax=Meripilus lineatus TaxID=2056292 RepID=A0AAD5VGD7_9APHY|nr:hypothetical protein NLI96_g531 [Physisporinus lineatus]
MFARVSASFVAVILFFIAFAVATPTPGAATDGSCSTGPIQCCQQTQTANGGGIITALLNLLNIIVDANALVGLDCSPITVIGVGQSQCNASPVCCDNNNVGGLLSIGCVPVQI